jgi:nuclear transport factor 2 (NTF2) superfamily protein
MSNVPEVRPPLPPFTRESAIAKVRAAEDGWNTRDPARVALAYTIDSAWRNRAEFVHGREQIQAFLARKWQKELDYRLIKELWAYEGNRIAVRFAYEWHDDSGNWFRSYGNENWEFDENGLMRQRHASINDAPIRESDRKYHWPLGRRPDDHPGLSDLGFERSPLAPEYPASQFAQVGVADIRERRHRHASPFAAASGADATHHGADGIGLAGVFRGNIVECGAHYLLVHGVAGEAVVGREEAAGVVCLGWRWLCRCGGSRRYGRGGSRLAFRTIGPDQIVGHHRMSSSRSGAPKAVFIFLTVASQ